MDQGTAAVNGRSLTAAGWVLGVGTTVAILGTPYLRFGYHSPELHLVLDSVDACIAALLAYLLVGRYRRRRRLQDLLLAQGLIMLAVAGLGLALTADLVPADVRRSLGVWVPLVLRATAALLIASAALVSDAPARMRSVRLAVLGPLIAALIAVTALVLLRDVLPPALRDSLPESGDRPVIEGHPLLIAVQGLAASCFLLASVLFAVQTRRRSDEVLRWLGPACALAGFARLNYLLFPSLYTGWVYTGDVLRTAGYACLLVGATREISRYWAARAEVAVIEDRGRLARELHDGLVQELGWIKSEARSMALAGSAPARDSSEGMQPIVDACDRALDEARAAVDALGRDPDEPLGYSLHRAAREVADRHGGRVVVELDDAVRADPGQRHELARITREAVGNALRHGSADCVRVTLTMIPEGRQLSVRDDGRGFDIGAATHGGGFGLTSMRERAERLPGRFAVQSSPGQGTCVEVTW